MKKSKVISRVLGIIITTVNVSLISAQPFPNGGYQGVTHGNRIPVHTICIPEGWSGISSYINPLVAEVDQICVPIESELVIMYNQFGLYWPGVGLNSLVNWDTHSGYVIKVTNDCSIELRGCNETDQVLSLPEGWSLIPVLSHDPVLVEDLFAGLDSLEVVKSIGCGNGIYWPRFGTNQLVYLHPGCGYYLRMNDPGSINFSAASDQSNPVKPADILYPSSPWNEVTGTPGSHLVVFNLADAVLEQGDIIGGFNQYGCCAGIVEVTCPDRPIAVALNGDDPYTMEIDGFVMDELLNYRIYRASSGEIFDMEVTYNPYMNTGYFEHHGMSEVMGVKMSASVVSNGASGDLRIYPNPTHGIFSIKGFDGSVNVQILNAFGVEIYVGEIYLPEKLDLTGRPKGVYIIRIDYRDEVYFRKLAIE